MAATSFTPRAYHLRWWQKLCPGGRSSPRRVVGSPLRQSSKGARMRRRTIAVAVAVAAAGALAVSYAAVAGQTTPDLEGTPDLIVRSDVLGHQWVVRDEKLAAGFCSVVEGGVTPGLRRLVRFTVMTPNVGDADIALGDPNEHAEADDGLYEFASCHNHY